MRVIYLIRLLAKNNAILNDILLELSHVREMLLQNQAVQVPMAQRVEEINEKEEEEMLHTAKYAAARIGITGKTIDRWVRSGELPVVRRVRRERMFRHSDIERLRRYYRGE